MCRDQKAYISSHRAMLALDKEAQKMYLEKFNCEVQLVHHMHLKFHFAVPVRITSAIHLTKNNI